MVDFSGLEIYEGGVYTITLNGTDYTTTFTRGDTTTDLATALADELTNNTSLTASPVVIAIPSSPDWNDILTGLSTLISSTLPITATVVSSDEVSLRLTGNVENVEFEIGGLVVYVYTLYSNTAYKVSR